VTEGTPGWKEAINALTMYYGEKDHPALMAITGRPQISDSPGAE
jgi:hypothetical protein